MNRPVVPLLLPAAVLAVASCRVYQLPSASMAPTILAGDYVIVIGSHNVPKRKEIVVYRLKGQPYIKRVVGLPGDTLAMSDGVLVLNGDSVAEPYAVHFGEEAVESPDFSWQRHFLAPSANRFRYHPSLTSWGPLVVPAGNYFLLGDNRAESADSRYTGFIDAASIFARPKLIYFSKDRHTGDIRWNRIGRAIRDTT